MIYPGDSPQLRKSRGAFFTPPAIADYLADWAVGADGAAKVLDPTAGEAVFLLAAGRRLRQLGADQAGLKSQLWGVDLHARSLALAEAALRERDLDATLIASDFFDMPMPDQLGAPMPAMDAVIGNPPFVRYQHHVGEARAKAQRASLRHGIRLSGLASSWASLLVHSCSFLKPKGRLAMVLPAELLTVGYAEPIRQWLRQRFEQVHLVLFNRLQFDDAMEKVVLVLAAGSGGCDAFSLYYLDDARDLARVRPMSNLSVTPADTGKWTDFLLPNRQRRLFKLVGESSLTPLATYGAPELGTVTGANRYFTLSETTRQRYGLSETKGQLLRVCPPGTRHLKGFSFSARDWQDRRDCGEPVWLLRPHEADATPELRAYLADGIEKKVNTAYKCSIRRPWWRPPAVPPPDLFFTYMSHRFPRLIENVAGYTFLNSMHGVVLRPGSPDCARAALPLVMLNSATMLGAEIYGRSYGGGILKMEPREAGLLPVPAPQDLEASWAILKAEKEGLEEHLVAGRWAAVVERVDEVLLGRVLHLSDDDRNALRMAARALREKRTGSSE